MVARYDPSGRYIGAGQYSGRGLVWNLETRSVVATLEGHVRPVTSIEFVHLMHGLLRLTSVRKLVSKLPLHTYKRKGLECYCVGLELVATTYPAIQDHSV
jgi:hypothetical protein